VAKLTREEIKADLERQLAELDEEDNDDFEVEIFDGHKGARVPYSKAKPWLSTTFGIDLKPPGDGDKGDKGDKGGKGPQGEPGSRRSSLWGRTQDQGSQGSQGDDKGSGG
jgi:hypothetical protein